MIKTRIICLALLMTAFSWGAARADEIRLQNGDRLTGAVIRMEGGDWFLRPPMPARSSCLGRKWFGSSRINRF